MSSEQKDIVPYDHNQLNTIPENEATPPPKRILHLTLSQSSPVRTSTREIKDEQGNVIGISVSSSSSFSMGMVSGDVEDLTRELIEKRGITNPAEIASIRAGLIARWEKQEAEEAQRRQEKAAKDARIKARKQAKAVAGDFVRQLSGGRKFLHTSGVGIDIEQLLEVATNMVTQGEEEAAKLKSVFHEANVIIRGLETNGGGISRKGDILRPRGINLAPGELYIPNITDLNLSPELLAELARAQIILKYDNAWMESFGFDPKLYKPKGSKVATFFLITPGFDYQTVVNTHSEAWEGRSAVRTLDEETYDTYIRDLFKRNQLPLIVSPRSLILSIRETNRLAKHALSNSTLPELGQ